MASVLEQLRVEVGEVVARHTAARGLVDFTKYRDDPEAFMREVLRAEPWSMQVEMANRVRDNARTICVTSNGLGKDWCTARIACWWAFARGGMVILTGPTERQVKMILMRELRRAFAAAPELPGTLYALELRINETSGILAMTSNETDKLTGFHAPNLLICITEGQGVDDGVYEAASACLTGEGNRLFIYGNPTSPQTGPFYRAATAANWNVLTIPATAHPNVISGRQEIPGAVSREWIALMRDEYGEQSAIYRSRVLAEFPTEAVESIATRANLERAFLKHESVSDESVQALHKPVIVSWDVALRGEDSNAVAVCQGTWVRELHVWRSSNIFKSYDKVQSLAGCALASWSTPLARRHRRNAEYEARPSWKPQLVIDASGLGAPAADEMKKRGFQVTEFIGAASAKMERYSNTRAESYFLFKLALEKGRLALPRSERLVEEFTATQWSTNTRDRIAILAKDEIRRTLGRSPDLADCVTMGLWFELEQEGKPQWGGSRYYGLHDKMPSDLKAASAKFGLY